MLFCCGFKLKVSFKYRKIWSRLYALRWLMHFVQSGGRGSVLTFFVQLGRGVLQMRTSKLFVAKSSFFSKIILFPHGQGRRDLRQCGHLATSRNDGSIFQDFVRMSFINGPYFAFLTVCISLLYLTSYEYFCFFTMLIVYFKSGFAGRYYFKVFSNNTNIALLNWVSK